MISTSITSIGFMILCFVCDNVHTVCIKISLVSECEIAFHTCSIVGRVNVGMSPVFECEIAFHTCS